MFAGSQLPLPTYWMLHQTPLPPPAGHLSTPPTTCISHAVLWTLGIEEQSRDSTLSTAAASHQAKLKTLVNLVFLATLSSHAADASSDAATTAVEGGLEAWQDPTLRSAATVLMHRLCSTNYLTIKERIESVVGRNEGEGWQWTLTEAKRLVEHFAATSFGDEFFGAAVAAAVLRSTTPLEHQVSVWLLSPRLVQ